MSTGMLIASPVDWTYLLAALIAGLPAIISAVGVILIHRQIRTPSRTSIGEQVENVLHTSLANHYRIRKIGGAVGADTSAAANTEAEQVPNLPEGDGEPL